MGQRCQLILSIPGPLAPYPLPGAGGAGGPVMSPWRLVWDPYGQGMLVQVDGIEDRQAESGIQKWEGQGPGLVLGSQGGD